MGMRLQEIPAAPTKAAGEPVHSNRAALLRADRSEFEKTAPTKRRGEGPVAIQNFFFLNDQGQRSSLFRWDEEITAVFLLGSTDGYDGLFQVSMEVITLQGQELLSCSDRAHGLRLKVLPAGETAVTMKCRLPLRAGKFTVFAGVYLFPDDARFDIGTLDYTRATASDLVAYAAFIEIAPQFNLGIYGPVHQDAVVALVDGNT